MTEIAPHLVLLNQISKDKILSNVRLSKTDFKKRNNAVMEIMTKDPDIKDLDIAKGFAFLDSNNQYSRISKRTVERIRAEWKETLKNISKQTGKFEIFVLPKSLSQWQKFEGNYGFPEVPEEINKWLRSLSANH